MSSALYDLLARLGYPHPIHPAFVHMPIGLTVGAFCLLITGWILRRRDMTACSYPTVVVALLFLLIVIPTGLMDWQRYYGGAWLFEIKMKLALAGTLVVLLSLAVIVGRRDGCPLILPVLYFLAMLNVAALGFFGGQLVYSGRTPTAPDYLMAGKAVFDSHCSGCHGRGGNIFMPNLPLRSAPQLKAYADFAKFLRNPLLPDGKPGPMPAFGPEQLTDGDLKKLYDYIQFAFVKPEREGD